MCINILAKHCQQMKCFLLKCKMAEWLQSREINNWKENSFSGMLSINCLSIWSHCLLRFCFQLKFNMKFNSWNFTFLKIISIQKISMKFQSVWTETDHSDWLSDRLKTMIQRDPRSIDEKELTWYWSLIDYTISTRSETWLMDLVPFFRPFFSITPFIYGLK